MGDRLCLRRAVPSDCRLLYDWRNDPLVRENSFHHESFPYEAHVQWFEKLLKDPDRVQYVLEKDGTPAGQIRIALENGEGIISYSIDGAFRGQGLGTFLLKSAEEPVRTDLPGIHALVGEVLPKNAASQRAFEKCGYQKDKVLSDRIVYRKDL